MFVGIRIFKISFLQSIVDRINQW